MRDLDVSSQVIRAAFGGIAKSTLSKYRAMGLPVSGLDQYPIGRCVEWFYETILESKRGTCEDTPDITAVKLDYWKAKTEREKIRADTERGDLMPVAVAQEAAFNSHRLIRDQVLSIADRCAALVAGETTTHGCKQILQTEIRYILEGLANALKV